VASVPAGFQPLVLEWKLAPLTDPDARISARGALLALDATKTRIGPPLVATSCGEMTIGAGSRFWRRAGPYRAHIALSFRCLAAKLLTMRWTRPPASLAPAHPSGHTAGSGSMPDSYARLPGVVRTALTRANGGITNSGGERTRALRGMGLAVCAMWWRLSTLRCGGASHRGL